MSKIWKVKGLLQNEGWMSPCFVATNEDGLIESISDRMPGGGSHIELINGYVIPGFQNAHSHSFQYAMSGLAEVHPDASSKDDFWSWRETMYNIALSISPDQFEAIATMLYAEMLAHGYTHVAEFHYVHHDQNGKPYKNLAEMGERLIAAAHTTGIGITLIPIFYQKGGFGVEPGEKQRRFISKTADDYLKLLEASEIAAKNYHKASIGIGIHSLRAVAPEDVISTMKHRSDLPIHIHIAEQLKEVEDCVNFHGKRPVEWLLDNVDLNESAHLVHATHLNKKEVKGIAKSGANVVLCPSTEGNLGDGLFPLKSFQENGGHWSIGTDSHIGLSPLEELRILDYGQRLTSHQRNQFTSDLTGDTGMFALDMALRTGRKAMGNSNEVYFKVGEPFDAVVIDVDKPIIGTSKLENVLATLIYSGDRTFFSGTITNGDWKIKDGKHHRHAIIPELFRQAVQEANFR